MLNITARDTDSFNTIKEALNLVDPSGDFLHFFRVAEQCNEDTDKVSVVLKNHEKFRKDLNRCKYIVFIPETLTIDSFEFVKSFEGPGRCRHPEFNVIIKASVEGSEVNFIFVLSGFNSDAIRIVRRAEKPIEILPDDDSDPSINPVADAIKDSIND